MRIALTAIAAITIAAGCSGGSGSEGVDDGGSTASSDDEADDDAGTAASVDDGSDGNDVDDDGSGSDGGSDDDGGESAMPIGIPEPEFGIHEIAPAMPDPWDAPIAGAYYVDITHPAATDDDAATGTPAAPRRSIPASLPAGATVWIAGGPYPGATIHADGTSDAPVFVTAADPEARPVIEGGVGLSGRWLVVEYLDIAGPESGVGIATPSDHVVVRHSEVRDGEGGGSGLYTGRWNPEDDPAVAEHIVFWNNYIHDNGDVMADFDEDHHGIALGHHASHVWILDNEMARNSGDGLQVNAKKAYLAETLHHVWVGRNVTHENKQTGLWSKQATDVVFTQNVSWGHRPSNSSGGAGIGFQYGPERLWIIFNEIYDCEVGVGSSTNIGDEDGVAGTGEDVYVVGNLVHGIHKQDGSGPTTDPWQSGAGLRFTDETATKHVVANTIVDTDVAFTYPRGTGGVEIVDNIMVASLGRAIVIETPEGAAASSVGYGFFDPGAAIDWGGSETDLAGLAGLGQCMGCVAGDPSFVDAAAGDYRLQPASPAVDAGGPTDVAAIYEGLYGVSIAVDFDRAPRVVGAAVDIGAFEGG
jgi:hypothetical protein